jgi:gliding motility-associated-like protein
MEIRLNIKPVANNDNPNVNEDTQTLINILSNDTDLNSNINPSSVNLLTLPINGTFVFNSANGTLLYTPNSNYNGSDGFTYSVCDLGIPILCDTAVVTINVTPVNDAPIANGNTATTNEDQSVVINVPLNDTDVDGNLNTGSVTITDQPNNGTVLVNPSTGSITYTPALNYTGTDTLIYQICDLGTPILCDTAMVIITITPLNDAPIANGNTATTNEDQSVVINVPLNDTDVDGNLNTGSVTITDQPNHGTVVVNPSTGSITYTPALNYNGTDTLIYEICDLGTPILCDTAIVIITVTPVNDAPIANGNTATTNEDQSVVINVPLNDTDVDGNLNTGSVTITDQPNHGTVVVNPSTGSITYTPSLNYNGTDTLIYEICDLGTPILCDTAMVIITITPLNDAPIANGNTATTNEDESVVIDVPLNDTDVDGNLNTGSVTITDQPNHGTVVVNPSTGSITYTPALNYNGTDTLIYEICDLGTPILCDTAIVIITVTPVNDAPIANGNTATTNEDQSVVINVPLNDTDVDGNLNTGSVTITDQPNHGTVVVNPSTGSITYTPSLNYNGTDTLIYQICDLGTPILCDTAMVIITVTPVNDAPIANGNTATTNEDQSVVINVPLNDTDVDGNLNTGSVTITDQPNNGTVLVNPSTGSITYTPALNYNGTDTLIYQICDLGTPILCDTAMVIITVTPVNDAPIANFNGYTTSEDTTIVFNPLGNDSDVDGNIDAATLIIIQNPINGSAILGPQAGEITYIPNLNFIGTDTLIYQVCDDGNPLPSQCDTAIVVITVNGCLTYPTFDCDGDGVDNQTEIANNTNPNNPCSYLQASVSLPQGGAWNTADCDQDGVTNGTEVSDGTNPNNPCDYIENSITLVPGTLWNEADCDGDGVDNLTETTDGTDPNNPCSYFVTSVSLTQSGDWLTVDCDGDGVDNQTETTDGTNPNNPCSFNASNVTLPQGGAWTNADCDDDGVINGTEVADNTNPYDPCDYLATSVTLPRGPEWNNADCDGDGVINITEVTDGTDINDPCDFVTGSITLPQGGAWNTADCDGDGVTNITEIADGTDPTDPCSFIVGASITLPQSGDWLVADCDGDGVDNGTETIDGTDPNDPCSYNNASVTLTQGGDWNSADCDGDGVTNTTEVNDGTDYADPCDFILASQTVATSPAWNELDCDNDGMSNGQEVSEGINPLNPCDPNSAFPGCIQSIFPPQGFSPDGNGINDTYVIQNIEDYPNNTFRVYNRWGNAVFQASPYQNNWDGTSTEGVTIGGNVLPVGTYFYFLELGDGSDPLTGYIYINR